MGNARPLSKCCFHNNPPALTEVVALALWAAGTEILRFPPGLEIYYERAT